MKSNIHKMSRVTVGALIDSAFQPPAPVSSKEIRLPISHGPIEIEFAGEPLAFKNEKKPGWGRKKDGSLKPTIYTDKNAKAILDSFQLQIPGMYRNLKLEHPDIEIEFSMATDKHDRDNVLCLVLDALRKQGVLREDNVRHCNGKITLMPAVVDGEWITLVRIYPK